jgi:hypothetical protein
VSRPVAHAFCVCLLSAAVLTGCGNSHLESLSSALVIGTWQEATGPARSSGGVVTAASQPVRRALEFKRDGSFALTVCDADGRPVEPAQTVTGTWAVRGAVIMLQIKVLTPDAGRAGWVPERFLGWQAGAPGPADDTLDFRSRDGVRVRYVRAPAAP